MPERFTLSTETDRAYAWHRAREGFRVVIDGARVTMSRPAAALVPPRRDRARLHTLHRPQDGDVAPDLPDSLVNIGKRSEP